MTDQFQHRMQQLQIDPPAATWDSLQDALEDRFLFKNISAKLFDVEMGPPNNTWHSLVKELDAPSLPIKRIFFPRSSMTVAASVLAVFGLLSWWIFFSQSKGNETTRSSSSLTVIPSPALPPTTKDYQQLAYTSPIKLTAKILSPSATKKRLDHHPIRSHKTGMISALIAYPTEQPIRVNAPIILDQQGNPVIDRNLLTRGNSMYISVTAPGGEPTQISSKLLLQLHKIYHVQNSNDEWQQRLEQWRTMLLNNPNYSPSMGNHMDLLELKELLEEQ